MPRVFDPTLCLVLGPEDTNGRDPVDVAEEAISGGTTMVQLRWKGAATDALVELGRRLATLTRKSGLSFIVNDDIEAAVRSGADGVHVGQSDDPPSVARARLGANAIIGLSIERFDQLAAVDPGVVDYLGVGPVLATTTKPDHAQPLGLEGFERVCREAALPVIAIGGVSEGNAAALRAAGADGLAVVSAICGAEDPRTAAEALKRAFLAG